MEFPKPAQRLHEAAAAARSELENAALERWEFFAKASFTREIAVMPNRPLEIVRVDETGVAVRSWRAGKAGFAAASGLGPMASRRAVEAAMESETETALDPIPPPHLLGTYEERPPRTLPPTGWATHICDELNRAIADVGAGRLALRRTLVHEGVFGWVLATSEGWVTRHENASTSLLIEVTVAGDRLGLWREWLHVPDHDAIDVDGVAAQIANRAMLTASRILTDSGLNDLILHPEVTAQLLAAISPLFIARAGDDDPLTALVDDDGRLAAGSLTVVDDRVDPGAPVTGPCDGEGLPARRTLLLDHGVPRHRLASVADAAHCGESPRGGALRLSYRDYPATGVANLRVDVDDGVGAGELLSAADRALYLLRPVAPVVCDPGAGSYRIIASGVWLDGTTVRGWHPVVELKGHIGGLLRRIDAVGNDPRWFQTGRGFVGAPSLLIRRQPVVG